MFSLFSCQMFVSLATTLVQVITIGTLIGIVTSAEFGSFADRNEFSAVRPRSGAPTMVQRALVSAIGYKQLRGGSQFGQTVISDSYNFRIRWYEPVFWGDNAGSDDSRHYDLQCWVEMQGQESRFIVNIRVSGSFTGYNEHYQFPAGMDVTVGCQIRAVNADGIPGIWRFSNRIRILEVPIYFPGMEGTDLRGLSNEELLKILAKAEQQAGPANPGVVESSQ